MITPRRGDGQESEEFLLEMMDVLDPGCFDSYGVKEFTLFIIFIAAMECKALLFAIYKFGAAFFNILTAKQEVISGEKMKSLGRLLGFEEGELARVAAELAINSYSVISSKEFMLYYHYLFSGVEEGGEGEDPPADNLLTEEQQPAAVVEVVPLPRQEAGKEGGVRAGGESVRSDRSEKGLKTGQFGALSRYEESPDQGESSVAMSSSEGEIKRVAPVVNSGGASCCGKRGCLIF